MFEYRCFVKGAQIVSYSEIEVINKIRESRDPDAALQIATELVIAYLMQKESSRSQSACPLPEPFLTTG